ncbi:MAG: helix-turn-helix domain-containing protein [Balneolia bacterium]|nr:helix-turn-helix domain-containing protein [Balneolia bacterium]
MYASIDIRNANDVLIQNLSSINTVSEWAQRLSYTSARDFEADYELFHGYGAETALESMKVDIARELLAYYDELTYAQIAARIGQENERTLNQFMKKHTGRNIQYFRESYHMRKIA